MSVVAFKNGGGWVDSWTGRAMPRTCSWCGRELKVKQTEFLWLECSKYWPSKSGGLFRGPSFDPHTRGAVRWSETFWEDEA